MYLRTIFVLIVCLVTTTLSHGIYAAEIAVLAAKNWDEFAPRGKEVDCIYGDAVLRNDRIVAVVAKPLARRNANMTVRGVGGCIIDLTTRERQSDQLSAFYPMAGNVSLRSLGYSLRTATGRRVLKSGRAKSGKIVVEFSGKGAAGKPDFILQYQLADGDSFLTVMTKFTNPHDKSIRVALNDSMRADRTFAFGSDAKTSLFWAYDEWFRQAYGVQSLGHMISRKGGGRSVLLTYQPDESDQIELEPGKSYTWKRRLFPAPDLLAVRGIAQQSDKRKPLPVKITVKDSAGVVANAKVALSTGENAYGSGRTDSAGKLSFTIAPGGYACEITALGRPTMKRNVQVAADKKDEFEFVLQAPGYVVGHVTDEHGEPIPCKVAFHGIGETKSPYFGPDSAAIGVQNLRYTHDGRFRQEIAPGKYEVIISRGPEYDAVFKEMKVERGKETKLSASLKRVVETKGWVSSDFHSHSSPSGDNTGSQFGRVLNLLAEHIEFGPCTEHNRVDTYVTHLKKLRAERLMATCTGMELTGSPLPVNHQNAFPLIFRPRTQDGGAPLTDVNPIVQIERLALWDDASEKLVQGNHPNIPQILGDRDLDGKADVGFEKMFGFMDVIEVHPPNAILVPPGSAEFKNMRRNPIFHWLQLLNLGYRITGVVNTDAHYNYHGSGGLRNWIKSSTDAPNKIDTMEMVQASEKGHVIMSTGPFMNVVLSTKGNESSPGETVQAKDGEAELHVRVQCPNWLDINRVQVFLNGRMAKDLNFTRRTTPDRFSDSVVKFDRKIPLRVKTDTHVIVAAAGEGLKLGRVMGDQWGQSMPIAVSNPIFMDVDGNGFKPNRDLLGVNVPLAEQRGTK